MVIMFQRDHVEKLLRLNGVASTSSDEEIKSILISAQWHKDDVEAAVLVLRENKVDHQTHVDSIHKVFRSDERLRPETISSLLGIDMEITSNDISLSRKRNSGAMTPIQVMQIVIISLVLSLIFVFTAMWYLRMGMFHHTLL
jgi:hypothetical protein